MKIMVVGDLFNNFECVHRYLDEAYADIVLCTGNIGWGKTEELIRGRDYDFFGVPFVFVHGSNDNFKTVRAFENKTLHFENFHYIKNGSVFTFPKNVDKEMPVVIGGIGGSYSPNHFEKSSSKRHFDKYDIEKLSKRKIDILLMHDLIGECSKKRIIFSERTELFFRQTQPHYCFVGRYHWFGYAQLPTMNVILMPKAKDGYVIIHTDREWDCERFTSAQIIKKN